MDMNESLSFEDKYTIIGKRDTHYEGIFFTAVKTTGIFCRPSCRARKPKIENVIFYDSIGEAIENGYRPCKICKPMKRNGNTPNSIKELLSFVQENPYKRIADLELRSRGIEAHTLRRWFKKNYGMTFHNFQKKLRINNAFIEIKKGKSITESAFESGYESLSAFNEGVQSIFSSSAKNSKNKIIIHFTRFESPIGALYICASSKGLCLLEFYDEKRLEKLVTDLKENLNAIILPGENVHLNQTIKELTEYFDGKRKYFSISLDMIGTDFRKCVWSELLAIPYGETRSYKEQAIALDAINSVRAVANANASNKISIIIPCHRVIGSSGKLTGYGGGIYRKKWLLDFEMKHK